ncbi:hypothetical protein [Bacteroides acidifaciens]|uniref:hypothetical protein n=1 Tax=Bacteroides acidifaciens TaxID=85831 RepID=UPI0025A52CF4|nr:hypothetical protein [Bacteroides acidifaciens]
MGIGIFKKIKNAFKNVGSKLKNAAQTVIRNIPRAVDIGKGIINRIKPIADFIPGVGPVVDTISTGLNYVSKANDIGKSILDKV